MDANFRFETQRRPHKRGVRCLGPSTRSTPRTPLRFRSRSSTGASPRTPPASAASPALTPPPCRNAYNLVLHKHGDLLYNGVRSTVHAHLSEVAEQTSATSDEQLLAEVSNCWGDHRGACRLLLRPPSLSLAHPPVVTMVMVRDILMYMDRTFVKQNHKTPVYSAGLTIFRCVAAGPHTPVPPPTPNSQPTPLPRTETSSPVTSTSRTG